MRLFIHDLLSRQLLVDKIEYCLMVAVGIIIDREVTRQVRDDPFGSFSFGTGIGGIRVVA
jgi:hypothetical protein